MSVHAGQIFCACTGICTSKKALKRLVVFKRFVSMRCLRSLEINTGLNQMVLIEMVLISIRSFRSKVTLCQELSGTAWFLGAHDLSLGLAPCLK